ncbi:protein translocase subunit secG [Albimonas donghaensis]|uniref:Protein-export membrane protein SecG n=1 Tax=Albimonas donghaensis TaxID=356660 RepID=A0A1H2RCE1_9RHOB|nr:preprotein translocase subunit SecG [Albimonas donghaensis]SDW16329.1 protein translocase subunit secG [Albimonas donghaensis]
MENVLLIVHLILAAFLIGLVLLQRSEGGALGIGGGGGGLTSSRGAATGLAKATWILAAAFIATSLVLTIIAAQKSGDRSVLDRLGGVSAPASPTGDAPADGGLAPDLQRLLTPPSAVDQPAAGDGASSAPASSQPATPPATSESGTLPAAD